VTLSLSCTFQPKPQNALPGRPRKSEWHYCRLIAHMFHQQLLALAPAWQLWQPSTLMQTSKAEDTHLTCLFVADSAAAATTGQCCSQYGWCGVTQAHCATGCQKGVWNLLERPSVTVSEGLGGLLSAPSSSGAPAGC